MSGLGEGGALEQDEERIAEQVDTYLRLVEKNPTGAEAFLARCLKARRALRYAFRDEDTGELLNMEDTICAIEDDYLARPSQAAPLPTEARRQMEAWVSEARARAMAAAELETEDAFEESQVDVVLDKLDDAKASFRFPRRVARRGGWWARKLIWALANLSAALGTAPKVLRELSPISKTGAPVAHSMATIRPLSIFDDLETVTDSLWL